MSDGSRATGLPVICDAAVSQELGEPMQDLEPSIPRSLFQNRKPFPAEVVYEVTLQKDGLPFGIAIADIEQSAPHFHKETVEVYTVVQGSLEVSLNAERHVLRVGDTVKIAPGVVHSARSMDQTPARISVTTIPEWSKDDYFPATQAAVGMEAALELAERPVKIAPDGSEIRELGEFSHGGLSHCTLPPGGISAAVRHKTVKEFWLCISGEGEVWRSLGGIPVTVAVRTGTSLTIPLGAEFQFRNTGRQEPLVFVIATMPPWPGPHEAIRAKDYWPTTQP